MNDIRKYFPIYEKDVNLHYFDSAASSLKLGTVADAISDYYKYNGTNVHRGVYQLAAEATDEYERTREIVANFIQAKKEEIIFTKGTSHALNMLANSIKPLIKKGDEIIVSSLEHHSSILPWIVAAQQRKAVIKYIPLEKNRITLNGFIKVLSNKTKIVALTHASNTLGYLTPIKEIIKEAHLVGAKVILDCAQSIAHFPVNVKELDVDYLAFSSHKLYGPNGVGILYGKKELLDQLEPSEFGGEMVYRIDNDHPKWKSTPYKFETGTPDIANVIGFAKVFEFLKKYDLTKIHTYEMQLFKYLINEITQIEDITIYNQDADLPILLFNIKDVHPHDVSSMLDQYNIAVRAGHHCSQHVMDILDQIATLRVSLGVYNTKEDVDALIKALKETIDFFKGF